MECSKDRRLTGCPSTNTSLTTLAALELFLIICICSGTPSCSCISTSCDALAAFVLQAVAVHASYLPALCSMQICRRCLQAGEAESVPHFPLVIAKSSQSKSVKHRHTVHHLQGFVLCELVNCQCYSWAGILTLPDKTHKCCASAAGGYSLEGVHASCGCSARTLLSCLEAAAVLVRVPAHHICTLAPAIADTLLRLVGTWQRHNDALTHTCKKIQGTWSSAAVMLTYLTKSVWDSRVVDKWQVLKHTAGSLQ